MHLNRSAVTTALLAMTIAAGAATVAEPAAFAVRGADRQVVAMAADLPGDAALLLLNRRGLVKHSLVPEGAEPVSWVSGYGSLTVNVHGPDFPLAGVNQAGLVVIAVPLVGAEYPARGRNAEIGPLQWVQYALDSFENVGQVVYSAEQYRIDGPVGYHFLACDAPGTCAIIEPVGGAISSRAADKLPLAILTSRTFDDAIDYLNVSLGYGGRVERTGDDPVLERFIATVDAVNAARSRNTATPVKDAFRILAEVEGESAELRVVFDPAARTARIATDGEPFEVPVLDFDLSCRAPRRMVTVPPLPEGAAEKAFTAWSPDAVAAVTGAAAGDALSAETVARMTGWADDYECSERPPIKHPADPASIPVD